MMKGYKALRTGLKAYGGFQYEEGQDYEIFGSLEMCKNGFHFCKNLIDVFGFYKFDRLKTVVYEVEAGGKIIQEGTKFCSEKIKLIRKIEWDEIDNLIDKRNNSGNFNSGYCNSGNFNSGDYDSGNHNSGNFNSGNHNSGDYDSGNFNSGYYNSGYYNSGFFNTNNPTIRLFNQDSEMTFDEFYELGINFSDLDKSKKIIKQLPGYDAQIFYDATGIDWRNDDDK